MIENILIFVRNCVMAVLTAWAGIQIADKAQPEKPESMPVAAACAAVSIKTANDGSNCPKRIGADGEAPASAASSEPDRAAPNAQPTVMTIR
jgi:hypothetical protein